MANNTLKLSDISDLSGKFFYIPSYQRGYRWTEQQVSDLLNDIYGFYNGQNRKQSSFYCLQPLVIVPLSKEKKSNIYQLNDTLEQTWYEVVDGQQRVTTIFLILKALKQYQNEFRSLGCIDKYFFTILYQREIKSEKKALDFLDIGDAPFSLDCYYLKKAYQRIIKWFEDKENDNINFSKEVFLENFLNRVQFIWYEVLDEPNPISVFTRLNIGKIPLTNSELIKALLLNHSNFNCTDDTLLLKQREIANDWDSVEYSLQEDDFWYFINDEKYTNPTRIDFIFDIVCDRNMLGLDSHITNGNDDFRTFRYFYNYFNSEKTSHDVNFCWTKIKTIYQIFKEWYDDLELYHYVGYLIAIGKKKSVVLDILKDWDNCRTKQAFLNKTTETIKTQFQKCNTQFLMEPIDQSNPLCKKILLFHNIQTIVNRNRNLHEKYKAEMLYRFPFYLYKLENWDVEHINSVTENEFGDNVSKIDWLMNRYHSLDESLQNKLDSLSENELLNRFEELQEEIERKVTSDNSWKDNEKNMLWNYVLLDAATNRSYKNAIFSSKRRILIGKDKGVSMPLPRLKNKQVKEFAKKQTSPFVPVCTKQVFLKYYSTAMWDNNYWTKNDAEAYLEDIVQCLNEI